ncbi:thiamine pyrophosphokinase [bacterium BMS3Bbin03]|nr:thiamine pyrophosphokinase [bacterium BMS3Bbin03]
MKAIFDKINIKFPQRHFIPILKTNGLRPIFWNYLCCYKFFVIHKKTTVLELRNNRYLFIGHFFKLLIRFRLAVPFPLALICKSLYLFQKRKLSLKNKLVLIFANGEPTQKKWVKSYLAGTPLIVAADGGANHLIHLGISPDFIVGDLDSVTADTLNHYPNAKTVLREDQNFTDLEKTLQFCLERETSEIIVFNATGGRADHALANLGLLQTFSRVVDISFVDNNFTIRIIRSAVVLETQPGQILSLIAIQPVSGITVQGVEFPLQNAELEWGGRGVSNSVTETQVSIQIGRGELFLFLKHSDAV